MDRETSGAAWDSLEAEAAGDRSLRWTAETLTDDNKAWLRALPVRGHAMLEGRSVSFFHGSPLKQTDYLWSDRPSRVFSRIAAEEGDDLFCFGHTHEAHHRVVGQAHLVGCGSVGCGTPTEATARYAIVYIGDPHISVGFRTVEYDVASVVRDMQRLDLPVDLLRHPPARHALPLHAGVPA